MMIFLGMNQNLLTLDNIKSLAIFVESKYLTIKIISFKIDENIHNLSKNNYTKPSNSTYIDKRHLSISKIKCLKSRFLAILGVGIHIKDLLLPIKIVLHKKSVNFE